MEKTWNCIFEFLWEPCNVIFGHPGLCVPKTSISHAVLILGEEVFLHTDKDI